MGTCLALEAVVLDPGSELDVRFRSVSRLYGILVYCLGLVFEPARFFIQKLDGERWRASWLAIEKGEVGEWRWDWLSAV